ncbi:MAG: hypothetical protein M1834_005872 [Cirrosporium novae-zelandiae]|nr:MAG: hypothetical protein M1834_005872 [Cirrosporium novae-zelandiae]
MSSMRNAVQRRNHRERAQPQEREKWGILEKHKDYSLRAADYKVKKTRLRILRQKATDRNPDEFHFGMMSSKGQGVGDRGNKPLSHDVVKLLKTQDAGYLRTMVQKTRRERQALEGEWVLKGGKEAGVLAGGGNGNAKHTVFVQNEEDQEAFDPEQFFGTDEKGLERSFNRPRVENKTEASSDDDDDNDNDDTNSHPHPSTTTKKPTNQSTKTQRRRLRSAQTTKLEALRQRERELRTAEQELELQRGRMGNSVGGINRNGVRWKVRGRKR